MPSFISLFTYAALGLAAFSAVSAAPLIDEPHSLRQIEARCGGCKTLPTIVIDLTTSLSTCLLPLSFGTSANITAEIVSPIIVEAKGLISVAIDDCNILVGQSLKTVLTGVNGVLTLGDFAGLLCTLITCIFSAVSVCLSVVAKGNLKVVSSLLCELLVLVASLLKVCLTLCSGLRVVLLPLIISIMGPVCAKLNLGATFSFLGGGFIGKLSAIVSGGVHAIL